MIFLFLVKSNERKKTTGKKVITSYTKTLTNSEYDLKPL